MNKLSARIGSYLATRNTEDRGATMVEYGLIVAAIALVVVLGAAIFGDDLSNFFVDLGNELD